MELTKEDIEERVWVKLIIPADNWPNPRGSELERTFVTTSDGKRPITLPIREMQKLLVKYKLKPTRKD